MTHTTFEFEQQLTKMGVEIIEFKYANGEVRQVIGFIGHTRYTWNAAGHCFQQQNRVPANDIDFDPEKKQSMYFKIVLVMSIFVCLMSTYLCITDFKRDYLIVFVINLIGLLFLISAKPWKK